MNSTFETLNNKRNIPSKVFLIERSKSHQCTSFCLTKGRYVPSMCTLTPKLCSDLS